MIERALIHVGGPPGSGKTAFLERILERVGPWALAARCVLDDSLAQAKESAPKAHPELARYRRAGAGGAAVFAFGRRDVGSDALFMTSLMEDYSRAVLLEGDDPVGFADLVAFVAPPLPVRKSLLVQGGQGGRAASAEESGPGSIAEILAHATGTPAAARAPSRRELLEDPMLRDLASMLALRQRGALRATRRWKLAAGYAGIERAGLVVVNVRSEAEREGAARLLAQLQRVRKDDDVRRDVLGPFGRKTAITAVVADLAKLDDPGTKKAVARIRRAIP
jgi:hypothetical protein